MLNTSDRSPFDLETGKLYVNKEKQYYTCDICRRSFYISIMFIPTDFVVNFSGIFARLVLAQPLEENKLCNCSKNGMVLMWLYDKKDLNENISESFLLETISKEQIKYFEIANNQGFLGDSFLKKIDKNILEGKERYARS